MPAGYCARCGAERRWLHKHHLKFQCDGGTDADGTMLVCANCHEDVHEGPMGGKSVAHRRHNPEVNARRAEAMRKKWEDPEVRAKMLNRKPRVSPTAAERLAQSERMRERWADPTDPLRASQAESGSEQSERMRERWADPSDQLRVSQDMVDKRIRELREAGHTIEQVADEVGCSRHTVMRRLQRTGGDPISPARSQQQRRAREAAKRDIV
jgi:methylphosphotriester-DNA--protein-cysteine methyltransferase